MALKTSSKPKVRPTELGMCWEIGKASNRTRKKNPWSKEKKTQGKEIKCISNYPPEEKKKHEIIEKKRVK